MQPHEDAWVAFRIRADAASPVGYSALFFQGYGHAAEITSNVELPASPIPDAARRELWRVAASAIERLHANLPYRYALLRRIRLPVFVEAPPGESREWMRIVQEELEREGLSPLSFHVLWLAPGSSVSRPPFRLPLNLLTVGDADEIVSRAINSQSWLNSEATSAGLQVSSSWMGELSGLGRSFDTGADVLICKESVLPYISGAVKWLPRAPRLVVALADEDGKGYRAFRPLPFVARGTPVLRLPYGHNSGSASEVLAGVIRNFAHDMPLHELGSSHDPGMSLLPPQLFSNPHDLNSLRLSDAAVGVQEEVLKLDTMKFPRNLADILTDHKSLSPYLRKSLTPESGEALFDVDAKSRELVGLSFDGESQGFAPIERARQEVLKAQQFARLAAQAITRAANDRKLMSNLSAIQGRVVDITLQHMMDGRGGAFIEKTGALTSGQTYRLRVQIGAPSAVSIMSRTPPPIDDLLPSPEHGRSHVLHVAFYSETFECHSPHLQRLELPEVGSSPGIHFEIIPKPDRQEASARIAVYYDLPPDAGEEETRNQLVQSFRLKATVSDSRQGPSLGSVETVLDFSTTRRFRALEALKPRVLSVALNDGPGDGTHTIMIKRGGTIGSVVLTEGQMSKWTDAVRARMDWASSDGSNPRFPADASEGRAEQFDQALARLASEGRKLYDEVMLSRWTAKVRAEMRAVTASTDKVIQVVHHATTYPFPWGLLYDFELPAEVAGQDLAVCQGFRRKHPDGRPYSCAECLDDCMLVNKREAVCAYGFWGNRHQVEQLLPVVDDPDKITEAPRTLCGDLRYVVGVKGTYADKIPDDLARLGDRALPLGKQDLIDLLWSKQRPGIMLIVGHYKTQDTPGELTGPRITLPGTSFLRPSELAGRIQSEDEWKEDPHSVVLLAACDGAAVELTRAVNFVSAFMQAGAGAVIGPEVPIFDGLARRFALDVASGLMEHNRSVGEAVLQFRRSLLAERNPLGLVFTPYGFADLGYPVPEPAPAPVTQ